MKVTIDIPERVYDKAFKKGHYTIDLGPLLIEAEKAAKEGVPPTYVNQNDILKHIEDGLNNGEYGHDAINIMTFVKFMPEFKGEKTCG